MIISKQLSSGNNDIKIYFPEKELSTDNAIMIAITGAFNFQKKKYKKSPTAIKKVRANGNLSL